MKNKVKRNGWAVGIISVCLSITGNAFADSGTWAGDVSGNWSNPANWVGGTVADGANQSAIFANDRTLAVTVTVDSDRTIGKFVFYEAGQPVTIDGSGVVTMVTAPGTTPRMTVFEPSVNISAALAGTMGVDFIGLGNRWVTLSGDNTFTGGSRISAMGLKLANAGGLSLNGDIQFESNGRIILEESEQIADTAVVAWADNQDGHFEMGGKNETIGGFQSNSGSGTRYIENGFITSSPSPTTVTIDTAAGQIYSWNGVLRGNTGSGFSIVKTGAGTQIFSGEKLSYSRGTISVEEGTLILNHTNYFCEALTVAANAILGGNGGYRNSVHFESGAKILFDENSTLSVDEGDVTFGGFGVADVANLDETVALGRYTLLAGTANFDFSNLQNIGLANAADVGNGSRKAYFDIDAGDLQVIVAAKEPRLTIEPVAGMLSIGAFDLMIDATNTLEFSSDLASGMWTSKEVVTGVTATNWVVPAENNGAFRITIDY